MNPITRRFTFLTSAFPHGAYQSQRFNVPELRGPSVKGQLRWWYDALFGDVKSEQRLFGYVSSKDNSRLGLEGNQSSRIMVRVNCPDAQPKTTETDFMPHKSRDGGKKNAIVAGTRYELTLLPRREGLKPQEQQRLERVLDAWLLLGAVGQRANRGAGSPCPENAPTTSEAYLSRANALVDGSKLRCAFLGNTYLTEHELRREAGDFIDGPTTRISRGAREVDVTQPWWPFGAAEDRKPSPLKLRAVRVDDHLRLLAIWDGRHHTPDNLRQGVEQLARQKEIGRFLLAVLPNLCA
jgi:CRISPR type III-B/RAMP module RAMP protein Cmr1